MSPRGSHSDVKSSDPFVLGSPRSGGRRLHRCIRRTLKPVCFDMLPAGTPSNGLGSGKVGYVDQCVVER